MSIICVFQSPSLAEDVTREGGSIDFANDARAGLPASRDKLFSPSAKLRDSERRERRQARRTAERCSHERLLRDLLAQPDLDQRLVGHVAPVLLSIPFPQRAMAVVSFRY